MKNKINPTDITEYYTYSEYRKLIKDLLKEQNSTSNDSDFTKYEFSLLNDKRMDRLDKKINLEEETIKKLNKLPKQTWVYSRRLVWRCCSKCSCYCKNE